jgi:adenylate kinase
MRLLMLAPPGGGKGTQGTLLAEATGVAHLSSGELLRAETGKGTPTGRAVAGYLARGDLVPDDLLFGLVTSAAVTAASNTGGFILDGFPRTLPQARRAHKIGLELDLLLDAVIYLTAPEPVLVRRLLDRARVHGRADDTPEVIRHRLQVFAEQTEPLADYYRNRGILLTVNADQSLGEVSAAITARLAERGILSTSIRQQE